MERFKGMLTSVKCTQTSMTLAFKNDKVFEYAKKVWDWVNGVDDRAFIMVVGQGECEWNENRQPFRVSSLKYDEGPNIAHLEGKALSWKDALHTYEINVGELTPANTAKFRKRIDVNKGLSIGFTHTLPGTSFSIPVTPDVEVGIGCDNCGTTGSFEVAFHMKTVNLIPNTATMTLSPKDVALNIAPKLSLKANMTDKISPKPKEIAKIPIAGISIPGGILSVGPAVAFSIGATIGPIEGSAAVSMGVSVKLPNTAKTTLNMLDPDLSATGWTPEVSRIPLKVEAEIGGSVKAFVKAAIELDAEVFSMLLGSAVNK